MDLERITTLQAAWGHEQSDQIGLQSVQSPEKHDLKGKSSRSLDFE